MNKPQPPDLCPKGTLTEFELIRRLIPSLPTRPDVVVGAGDDCAVLDLGLPDLWVLFKTDAVVEGVHFTREASPTSIGHKALGRCLSDVAAMAGQPVAAVVALGLPEQFAPEYVEGLYQGMSALARRYQVAIVGGETTRSPGRLTLTVSLLGTVSKRACVRRTGAVRGDALFVTGELGGAMLGWHLAFEPRLEPAWWLAEHFKPHAMIDISDGLAGDLRHLMAASGCGAELLTRAIPISPAARRQAQTGRPRRTALAAALTDGEDFELLFAVGADQAVALRDAWSVRFPDLRLSCIGRLTNSGVVTLRTSKGLRTFTEHGYDHFA